jgi:hypothetical protein
MGRAEGLVLPLPNFQAANARTLHWDRFKLPYLTAYLIDTVEILPQT